jgi:hypothetical protein
VDEAQVGLARHSFGANLWVFTFVTQKRMILATGRCL